MESPAIRSKTTVNIPHLKKVYAMISLPGLCLGKQQVEQVLYDHNIRPTRAHQCLKKGKSIHFDSRQ